MPKKERKVTKKEEKQRKRKEELLKNRRGRPSFQNKSGSNTFTVIKAPLAARGR